MSLRPPAEAPTGSTVSASSDFSVASINLHWGRDVTGRPFDVADACSRVGADVIALQEVWTPVGGESVASAAAGRLGRQVMELPLTDRADIDGFRIVDVGEPGRGSWGLAILTAAPVVDYRTIALGQAHRDSVARAVQVVVLEVAGGRRLRVVNTHLTHRVYQSPWQFARLVRRLGRPELPTVVLGDLNLPGLVAATAPGLRRAVRGATWPARHPRVQLDHILVSPECAVTGSGVGVEIGSDHRPVRASLRISGQRGTGGASAGCRGSTGRDHR